MPRRGKKKAKGLKPFLKRSSGAIKPPTDPPASDGAQPAEDLELRYVHGYRGHDTRNNVHWLNGTEAVFFVAAVGVVHDLQADKQRFFKGHTDDIVSMALHPDRSKVATGQMGKTPLICVWDTATMEPLSVIKGFHQRAVICLAFDATGKTLASVGQDDDHMLATYDWAKGSKIGEGKTNKDKILDLAVNPADGAMVSVGPKHIKFHTAKGGTIEGKKGIFGKKGKIQTILCATYTASGDVLTGTYGGDVYKWSGRNLAEASAGLHKGGVFAIHSSDMGIASGGKDGVINILSPELKVSKSITVTTGVGARGVRSISWLAGAGMLVGTKGGQILKIDVDAGTTTAVLHSHGAGELWGLAPHPTALQYATASDDETVRLWDAEGQKMINATRIEKKKIRSIAYAPDAKHIAVGSTKGDLVVLDGATLETVTQKKHRKEQIGDLKYSPDGKYLAVGSNDNFVDVYDVAAGYKRIGVCKGHTSYITHLDWSQDSSVLQTTSGDYELLFWDALETSQIKASSSQKDQSWHTWTCTLGWPVLGIWPAEADGTDVNSVARTHGGTLMATADDFGTVKLFKYPAPMQRAKSKKYVGHSSHVTNVRWTVGDKFCISVGGLDTAVFQWELNKAGGGHQEDSTDDDSEDDSDADAEKGVKAPAKSGKRAALPTFDDGSAPAGGDGHYRAAPPSRGPSGALGPVVKTKVRRTSSRRKYMPPEPAPEVNTGAPTQGLTLEAIKGFRGHDSRDSCYYTASGEALYMAAGVAILHNLETNQQRFFREHDDDIVAMAYNAATNTVATGQLGASPRIYVWDASTMELLSTLVGFHKRGISCLAFSASGASLASAGMDKHHSVAVWDWKAGELLASARGSPERIVGISFQPGSETRFATCGIKHLKFWSLVGNSITPTKPVYAEKGAPQSYFSLCYIGGDVLLVGALDGDIYQFAGNVLQGVVDGAHAKSLFAMSLAGTRLATGAKDGRVRLWDVSAPGELPKQVASFELQDADPDHAAGVTDFCVRSLNWNAAKGKLLVGTKANQLYEIGDADGKGRVVNQGHSSGVVSALDVHPSKNVYVTGGDDASVRVWDMDAQVCIARRVLAAPVVSLAYSPDGALVAAGQADGKIVVLDAGDLAQTKAEVRKRSGAINVVKFAPSGKLLASGSADSFVDLFDVGGGGALEFKGSLMDHAASITALDWSADSLHLQSNCAGFETLYWDVATLKNEVASSKYANMQWASWSLLFGWPTQGIWPMGASGEDINSVARSPDGKLLALGDDFGFVKVFNYPVPMRDESKFRVYPGHSAQVTNVRFSHDGSRLITVGGADLAVFQWRVGQVPADADSDAESTDGEDDDDLAPPATAERPANRVSAYHAAMQRKLRNKLTGAPTDPEPAAAAAAAAAAPEPVAPAAEPAPQQQSAASTSLSSADSSIADPPTEASKASASGEVPEAVASSSAPPPAADASFTTTGSTTFSDTTAETAPPATATGTGTLTPAAESTMDDYSDDDIGVEMALVSKDDKDKAQPPPFIPLSAPDVDERAGRPRLRTQGQTGDTRAPVESMTLEFAHGYRCHDARNNLFYNAQGHAVYMTAALGIIYNPADHSQRFFRGHTDDIISLAMSPDGKTVATGEVGKKPAICVWDAATGEQLARLTGFHQRGVCCLGFSPSGKTLASVGLDNYHSIALWDWASGKIKAQGRGHNDRLFGITFTSETKFVTCGIKHIKFWTCSGNSFSGKKGIFGKKGKLQPILCAAAGASGTVVTGTAKGDLYVWKDTSLAEAREGVHAGGCNALFALPDGQGFVTGGNDGNVRVWDAEAASSQEITVGKGKIRGVCKSGDAIIVGVRSGDILQVDAKSGAQSTLVTGHGSGELWALAPHPSKDEFCTGGEDKRLVVWDAEGRRALASCMLDKEIRSAAYSPDGAHIAVGCKDGSFAVVGTLNMQTVARAKDRKEKISDVRYSPDGQYLAVGSHDNYIDIYDVSRNYSRVGTCKGHSSYITHIDFSSDSRLLQSNCGAYDHLYFEVPSGKRVNSMSSAEWASYTCVLGVPVQGMWPKCADGTDINACARSNGSKLLATGDDFGDVKLFKYPCNMPATKFKAYKGHSSHVTNVRFSHDDRRVLSTGGGDLSVMQWRLSDSPQSDDDSADSEAEDVDSDLAADPTDRRGLAGKAKAGGRSAARRRRVQDDSSDEDDEDDAGRAAALAPPRRPRRRQAKRSARGGSGGYEAHLDTSARARSAPRMTLGSESPRQHMAPGLGSSGASSASASGSVVRERKAVKPGAAPADSLELDFVFGYRGHDCRNNLFYTKSNEVVFNIAAVGVVYTEPSHTQRFYRGHDDDIISLAYNARQDIVASGQVGKTPTIHVWDPNTMETLAVLKGFHERGVCSLGFSEDGKILASIGLDNNNSVALYDWKKGQMLSNARGHGDKIFFAEYAPDGGIVTGGMKHVKMWTVGEGSVKSKKGTVGKVGKVQTMLCCTFDTAGKAITGTSGGQLYHWQGTSLGKSVDAHKGPVYAVAKHPKGILSGGKDGIVKLWSEDLQTTLEEHDLHQVLPAGSKACIRSLYHGSHGVTLVGLRTGEIIEIEANKELQLLLQGHGEGELWGLGTHPTQPMFATGSDDATVRVWSAAERRQLLVKPMPEKVRSVAYSPDGKSLAVGMMDGSFAVLDAASMDETFKAKKRKERISEIRYSPDGKWLAVGSADNFVDIYSVDSGYKFIGACRGHSSFITHLDWSEDSQALQTENGAHQKLLFDGDTAKQIFTKGISWQTWTCILGKEVQGIWPKGADKTDINGADRSKDSKLLATSDDFGDVKLFAYPVTKKSAKHKVFKGHSSHVTNVRFTHDDEYVLSTGGLDAGVFQWRVSYV